MKKNMIISEKEEEVTNKNNMESSSSPSLSFMSLPDDLILSCVARVSRSYYPSLSLVSKSFRSLISSPGLRQMRPDLKIKEKCVCVCLQLPNHRQPSWFSLWIKKTQQTLTMDKQNSTGNHLVPMLHFSPYTPLIPIPILKVGSESYALGERYIPSSRMLVVGNGSSFNWPKAPSMSVPRARVMNPHAAVLHEKIYVMGGCKKDESTNWAEVFDPKTQTWDSLPDPGEKVRFSLIKKIWACNGKLYVIINEKEEKKKHKHCVYVPEKGKWDIAENTILSQSICVINNVTYTCVHNYCSWYDTELKKWRQVMNLDLLNGYHMVEITGYGEKLVIFLEEMLRQSDPNKNIWCAMVSLERRHGGEVWGQIEWTDIVRTVPKESTLLNCEITWF